MSRRRISTLFMAATLAFGALWASSYVYGLASPSSIHPTTARVNYSDYSDHFIIHPDAYQRGAVPPPSSSQQPAALSDNIEPLLGITVKPLRSPWTANKDIREQISVLVMNNFNSEYLQGGVIPRRGAEIAIVADATRKSLPSVDALMADFLKGDKVSGPAAKMRVAGCDTSLVDSETDFGPSLAYKRTVALVRGHYKDSLLLSKFVLSYNVADDELLGKSFKDAFRQVLGSASATPFSQCLAVGTN